MDLSQQDLQTYEKLLSHFKFLFQIFAENRKMFKRTERRDY